MLFMSFRNAQIPKNCVTCEGELHNTNTIETFKTCDKKNLLDSIGKKASML